MYTVKSYVVKGQAALVPFFMNISERADGALSALECKRTLNGVASFDADRVDKA